MICIYFISSNLISYQFAPDIPNNMEKLVKVGVRLR